MPSAAAAAPDLDLVARARQGDRQAFDALLLRHDERMRGLAYRLLADRLAMDEAIRRAYLEAYRGMPGLRPGKDFGTWLYRLTYNACIDELRHRRRIDAHRTEDDEPAATRGRNVSTSEVVREALSELPPSQRVTVVLVDGEGFEHTEAADILGVAPGTVASRLYRARTKLRRRLWDEVR